MRVYALLILIFLTISTKGQLRDSAALEEVVVNAYFSQQPLLRLPASASILSEADLQNHPPFSLVPSVNTVPGVRMEERSPGSYRLSIRGSLLRSPFGVRNVKVYLDDFMLTDAGGNTYLNLLDAASSSGLEILKGPEGSIYGANTGGVVVIKPYQSRKDTTNLQTSLTAGSFGLFHQKASFQGQKNKLQLNINQAYQRSDGFRRNSELDRKYIHLLPQWQYSNAARLKAFFLFSDLHYETPGGLTLAQYQMDPKSARPRSGNTPGAIEQNAGIFNQTFLGGISHDISLSKNFKHVVSFTGSFTDFKNPTINNYELRDERSIGLRTYLEYRRNTSWSPSIQIGLEAQQTRLDVDRYNNDAGERGAIQNSDLLKASQGFAFAHFSISPVEKLFLEAAASLNGFRYAYRSFFPEPVPSAYRSFKKQVMPRLAASYLLSPSLALRGSFSRGYSPPSLEEVNPSNREINVRIEAEKGWNREAGFRLSTFNNRIYWDAVYFNYKLKDAIVRQVSENESDYYVNAGSTRQQGVESEIKVILIKKSSSFLTDLQLKNSYTFNYFKFGNYVNNGNDYSGNWLTDVPKKVIVTSLESSFQNGLSFFLMHNYSSSIPLNDANSAYASRYHVLGCKGNWRQKLSRTNLSLFAGIDNLFDQKYSLGNDLNAFGSRYYNAAAGRNFYAGLSVNF